MNRDELDRRAWDRLDATIERRGRHAAAFEKAYSNALVVVLTAYTSFLITTMFLYLLGVQ